MDLGWDISLRTVLRRASSEVSKWLRDDNYGSVPIGDEANIDKGGKKFGNIQTH